MNSDDSEAGTSSNGNGAGKQAVTLTLDRNVVERLQQTGDNWEERVNDLLRAALNDRKIEN
jgi:uncharacterized protein (DUF4415 family)